MDIKEKAKQFAIKAHKGQVRKSEPDKPMIIHPISVGMLLEEYGYDNKMIAAGFLHDVVEDTNYTLEDIEKEFGSDIADLVKGASESDKSLSWKERKQQVIDKIRKLPLRNKLVIAADKVNNLEDLMLFSQKKGKIDFSKFNAGGVEQKWFYTNLYESLIAGEDSNIPMFVRLKKVIDIVFYDNKDKFLEDLFSDNIDYYNRLISLNAQKIELQRLRALCDLSKPFVIEFCDTPRTGKTTILHNLHDFFKKGGLKVSLIEELTTSKYYKEKFYPRIKNMGIDKINICLIEETLKQLQDVINQESDIIMIDRSLNDRMIWNHGRMIENDMTEEQYHQLLAKYPAHSKELIDKYNDSTDKSMDILQGSVAEIYRLDTTNITPTESSALIAERIMRLMRSRYIDNLNEMFNK